MLDTIVDAFLALFARHLDFLNASCTSIIYLNNGMFGFAFCVCITMNVSFEALCGNAATSSVFDSSSSSLFRNQ